MTKGRHIPQRSCVACGTKMPKPQLFRIVKTGQRSIKVDDIGREPGRGAYVCRAPDCWDKVLEKGVLDRSFKRRLSENDLEPVRTYYQKNLAPRDDYPKL